MTELLIFEVDVKNVTEWNRTEGTRLGFLCGCEILETRGWINKNYSSWNQTVTKANISI